MNIISPALEKYIQSLPPEKREAATRQYEQFFSGVMQGLVGDARRAFAEKFLSTIGSDRRMQFDHIIDLLEHVKDSNSFKPRMVAALAFAYESGIGYAVEALKR